MARIITKPIVCIIGSRTINNVNLDRFIDSTHVAAVVSGGASGVDTLAEKWAKKHKVEFIIERPNYKVFGRKAPLERDKDMVNESDVIIAF